MNKRKISIAALMIAAMVIVAGCKPNQDPPASSVPPSDTQPNTPPASPKPPAAAVSEEDIAGASVEFYGVVEIGELRVTVASNTASAYFKRNDGTEYVGNGVMTSDGVLEFPLRTVDNTKEIPFKATYNKAGKSLVVSQLTKDYPYAPVSIARAEQGNIRGYQRTFVRKVGELKNGLNNGVKDIAATFFITLDSDKVMVAVYYGNDEVGMSSLTQSAVLEGNVVRMDLDLAGVAYRLKLVFNEDSRDESGTSDTNTVWYLGRLNERYNKDTKNGEPEYVGGFYLSEAEKTAKGKVAELNDSYESKRYGLQLCTATHELLGSLDIEIKGPFVTFRMTNIRGEKKERHVWLKKQTYRPHVWESQALASARAKTKDNKDNVVETERTVFVFLKENKGDSELNTYDTFDFKISDYDPKTGKFCLKGKYLLEKNPQDAQKGGIDLIEVGVGDTVYLRKSSSKVVPLSANEERL